MAADSPLALKSDGSTTRIARTPQEIGASGTENYNGWLVGLDYNSLLAPPHGFTIYDEMRRSDPQVHASLEILKLPLLSATWTVQAPDNPTPQEQELADYCQAVLLEQGAMTETWDFILRHALLLLDFGCSTLEKTYVLKATPFGEKVALDRLAPRLPVTLERFLVDERGKLTHVVQRALKQDGRGGGTYRTIEIPAARVVHLVHRREGDNYFGESMLRSAYKPWLFKFQAEKADAVRVYRQVAGVPMASFDVETASKIQMVNGGPDVNEIAQVDTMLAQMASSRLTQLRTSTLWKWTWLHGGAEGAKAGADVEATIQRHDRAILRNVLGDFMSGTPDGLNSGKTRTLTDFFGSALYALAQAIEDDFSLHVLRPLCAFNFPVQGLRYPRLVANDVTDVDGAQLADVLGKLGDRYIRPDDPLEEMLRKVFGFPPADPTTTRKAPTPPPFPGAPATGAAEGEGDGEDDPDIDDAARDDAKGETETATDLRARPGASVALKGRSAVYGGRTYSRVPTAFELAAFNVAEVPDTLDHATVTLQREIVDIRRKQLDVLASKLSRSEGWAAGRPDSVVVPFKKAVTAAFKSAVTTIAQYGRTQVQVELAKQGADVRLVAASSLVVLAGGAGRSSRTMKSALTTSATIATEKETDYWVNRIIESAARLKRNGITGADLASRIVEVMTPEVEQGTLPLAKSEINEAFSIGRQAEATAQKDQIDHVEYSALLDANTCAACEALDGQIFPFESEQYWETLPPYQHCEGNKGQPDACRCAHIFHAKSGGFTA